MGFRWPPRSGDGRMRSPRPGRPCWPSSWPRTLRPGPPRSTPPPRRRRGCFISPHLLPVPALSGRPSLRRARRGGRFVPRQVQRSRAPSVHTPASGGCRTRCDRQRSQRSPRSRVDRSPVTTARAGHASLASCGLSPSDPTFKIGALADVQAAIASQTKRRVQRGRRNVFAGHPPTRQRPVAVLANAHVPSPSRPYP